MTTPFTPPASRLRLDDCELDIVAGELRRGADVVPLRPKSFELLCYFATHPGRLLTKDELMSALWPSVVVTDDSLVQCVRDVRIALGTASAAIQTVQRRGYRLRMPDTDAQTLPMNPVPAATPSLIGRDDELGRLKSALAAHRLVTIAGAGGVGKTSLARRLVDVVRCGFDDGVCWVDLSVLSLRAEVTDTVAAALKLSLPPGMSDPAGTIAAHLDGRSLLLVLDNAEHVADSVARLVLGMLKGTRRVALLVTSQVPLRLIEEQVVRLSGLPVPPASTLFLLRAMATEDGWRPSADEAGAVADICRALDGNPLAIELAAARVPLLGVSGVQNALGERLDLLRGGARLAHERHRSLREALNWTWQLLGDPERLAFLALGEFGGAFRLATAQHLLQGLGLDRWGAADALQSLIDHGLVACEVAGVRRLRLLETPRALAREHARTTNADGLTAQRHAQALAALFVAAEAACADGLQRVDDFVADLEPDLPDGRQALAWSIEHEPITAIVMAPAFARALSRCRYSERRAVWERSAALVAIETMSDPVAHWCCGAALFWAHLRPPQARRWAEAAAAHYRRNGQVRGLYRALAALVVAWCYEPCKCQELALIEMRSLESPAWPAVERTLGAHAEETWLSGQGYFAEALDQRLRKCALEVESGHSEAEFSEGSVLIDMELAAGRVHDAVARGEALRDRLRGSPLLPVVDLTNLNLFAALLAVDRVADARHVATDGWHVARQCDLMPSWCDHLVLLAELEGRADAARRLLVLSDALHAADGKGRGVNEAASIGRALQRLGADVVESPTGGQSVGSTADEIARLAFGVR